jgi:hypothetical protein
MPRPVAQVHTHHRDPGGSVSRTMSRTTSATAHPAVITAVTVRSSASRGGAIFIFPLVSGASCLSGSLTI